MKLKAAASESDYSEQQVFKVDWLKTCLFKACMEQERFKRPDLNDEAARRIVTHVTNMRLNP